MEVSNLKESGCDINTALFLYEKLSKVHNTHDQLTNDHTQQNLVISNSKNHHKFLNMGEIRDKPDRQSCEVLSDHVPE